MNKNFKYSFIGLSTFLLGTIFISTKASVKTPNLQFSFLNELNSDMELPPPGKDTTDLKFPFEEKNTYPQSGLGSNSPLYLKDPSNLERTIVYDPETKQYIFSEKIGNLQYRPSSSMSIDEYRKYEAKQSMSDYWLEKVKNESPTQHSLLGKQQINIGGEAFSSVFGTNTIDITPQGSAELIFAFNLSKTENPTLSERLRKVPSFVFEEQIQMSVTGSIGNKMDLGIEYNTEATFDFENKTKLAYAGEEDEIIKKIEAGNITLPLPGTLITGSQSLFGLKTELQFGKLTVTTVLSQQKGESSVIEMKNGAQAQEFEVEIDDYDANRHYFLSHYFKDHYDQWLSEAYPKITSPIKITKIEVWITNANKNYENSRNIIAFADLGEGNDPEGESNLYNKSLMINDMTPGASPSNDLNNLYQQLIGPYSGIRDIDKVNEIISGRFDEGIEYEKIENARRLSEREFTLNSELGYISLNTALNADEVLMVAYEYTNIIDNGKTYKVGELTTDALADPNTIVTKLIKGTSFTPKMPVWELMMKNIYAIGAYQVENKEFYMEVLFRDDQSGTAVNYLNDPALPDDHPLKEETLLSTMGLDRLNAQGVAASDGKFDFKEGVTIYASNGRIIFPVLEPFGDHLRKSITQGKTDEKSEAIAKKYVFDALYDSTRTIARQIAEKNKFFLAGTYQSSSGSEISLNAMNVPKGSVKVTAGGRELTEGFDYTVDYMMGKVRITNPALMESGTPIKVSLESQSLFNIQTKTMIGTHVKYEFNENFILGATALNLTERPLTNKVSFGDEPISNTIWGLNTSYRAKSQALTTLIDKLPLIETKEISTFNFDGEFAQLIPGQAKAIGKGGISYIDDFEGSETSMEMKMFPAWKLASTPPFNSPSDLPTADYKYYDVRNGYNRAKFAWYTIDQLFLRNNSSTPTHIQDDDNSRSSHYVRLITEKEIWPEKDNSYGNIPTNMSVLNIAYYPKERGPYNFDSENIDPNNGKLLNPTNRWGGIMREIPSPDFETANVEFIEFWLMDPYVERDGSYYEQDNAALIFNLGNVSEDVLKDSKKMFENGMPTTAPDSPDYDSNLVNKTPWGYVPSIQEYVSSFDNDKTSRDFQDVGLDGLSDDQERGFYQQFLKEMEALLGGNSSAYKKLEDDPSSDDFHYYRGEDYDEQKLGILERYKKYNGLEGNSPIYDNNNSINQIGTFIPDVEDLNKDNTLSESENFYQYKIPLDTNAFHDWESNPLITDRRKASDIEFPNGQISSVYWYQFKIPVRDYDQVFGNISGFESIRFMRMYLTGFQDSVFLRFAKLDLVRSDWRKYQFSFKEGGEGITIPQQATSSFDILAVNIEENSDKYPVNYILPPGVTREQDPMNPQMQRLNEQSLVIKVTDLPDGDARAAYKTVDLDIREYKKLKMFIHAEAFQDDLFLKDGELTAFIRLGSDYKNNYYEYEIPLLLTPSREENGGKYNDKTKNGVDLYHPDRYIVWPDENQMIIELDKLKKVKQQRNVEEKTNRNVTRSTPFSIIEDNIKITVVGNPNLSNIRTIMLGVRNPNKGNSVERTNDQQPKSAEVWFNELRLTDFNNQGGWAATASLATKLADVGTFNIAGSMSTPGFGSLDKKVNERSKETLKQYDASATFQLGKIFDEEKGVNLPIYYGKSETFITPQYDPTNPDIIFEESLKDLETKEEKDKLKKAALDHTKRTSFNLANVSIAPKKDAKSLPWNISNFSTTFSRNVTTIQNIYNIKNNDEDTKLGIIYNWNAKPVNVAPFKKSKALSGQNMRIIKDFNVNLTPSRVSLRTDYNRYYNEVQLRNIYSVITNSDATFLSPTFVDKELYWNRNIDVKWDLSRSLRFNFSTNVRSRLEENPYPRDNDAYKEWKDSVMSEILNISDYSQMTQYNHKFDASYNVPINKIPMFNWVTLSTKYSGQYYWDYGPPNAFGNIIRNSNSWQNNSQLNLINLYNKVDFLKKINSKYGRRGPPKKTKKEYKDVTFELENVKLKQGLKKSIIHKLKTEDVKIKAIDATGKEVKGELEVISETKVKFKPNRDAPGSKIIITGKVEKKDNPLIIIAERTTRALMLVRNVSGSYKRTGGTTLPGYNKGRFNEFGVSAPGLPFLLGIQDKFFAEQAIEKEWLVLNPLQLNPYLMTKKEDVNFRSTIEPFGGLKIDVTANRSYSENNSEYYVYNETERAFPERNERSLVQTGNFSMSFLSIATAFDYSKDFKESEAFNRLKSIENRQIISKRLAENQYSNSDPRLRQYYSDPSNYDPSTFDPNYIIWDFENHQAALDTNNQVMHNMYSQGYDGYSLSSQQVLIPAFLAAYGGYNFEKISLKMFPWFMMPNWRVRFDGLSKIEFIKKYMRSITLNHTYRSTYSVASFSQNTDYDNFVYENLSYARDMQQNFSARYEAAQVTINEQFSPLFGLDMNWKNSLTTRFEIKRSRNILLSLANSQITEMASKELVIGAGYRFEAVKLNISSGGNKREFESDVNLKVDFSIRDNITMLRKLEEVNEDPLSGMKIFTIKVSADYKLSDRFTFKLFWDNVVNTPWTSLSYPTANTDIGFTVRFDLI